MHKSIQRQPPSPFKVKKEPSIEDKGTPRRVTVGMGKTKEEGLSYNIETKRLLSFVDLLFI